MPTSLLSAVAATPSTPIGNWGFVFSTTATGIVVVFLILVLLIIMIWLLGKVMRMVSRAGERSAQKKLEASSASQKAATTPPPAPKVQSPKAPAVAPAAKGAGNQNEVVAAIAAAIHMIGQSEGKQYQIRKIEKRERKIRSAWGNAGVRESMNSD